MERSELLTLCDEGAWLALDIRLKEALRSHPDSADIASLVAHAALRQGNKQVARFFIHKAQSLEAHNISARIEDICLDFYEARFELARQKLGTVPIVDVPIQHPVHAISLYVHALFGDEYPFATMNVMATVQEHLKRGDKLLALLVARIGELNHPAEADSFAALGLANLYAGFYKNADQNFHEAVFRNTRYIDIVNIHHFYLFCRQARYSDALTIGFNIEKQHKLDAHGQGLLLEMMIRSGKPLEEIERRITQLEPHLTARKEISPVVEVVKLRIAMIHGALGIEAAIALLASHVKRTDCPAAFLYLYAQLQVTNDLPSAKHAAARALMLDHLHPDAAGWDEIEESNQLNFEFAGLFIPREHEGSAWPTEPQMQLLNLLFTTPENLCLPTWEAFSKQHSLYTLEAGAYRLLPYVYKQLEKYPIREKDLLRGIWKKCYIENALKMKYVLAVRDLLATDGINIVLLKGLANAASLYGDLGSRPMSDVDILVPIEQLNRAHSLLDSHGWHTTEKPTPDRMRFAYGITYRHPEGGMLDVHWRPCEVFSNKNFDMCDLGEFSEIELMEKTFKTLSPTLNLFCTIYHGVEWNHLSPVRWVADALLTMRKNKIDWGEIDRLAVKYQALPVIAMGLKFLAQFEDLSHLPDTLKTAMNKDYSEDVLMMLRLRPRNVISSIEEAIAMLEHLKGRFTFGANDYIFICGGDNHEYFKAECLKRDINWLPFADQNAMLQAVHPQENNFTFIVIDANLSCSFNCFSGQKKTIRYV